MLLAQITCLRPGGYPLLDLGLRLKRGIRVTVTGDRAQASTDLTQAVKTGAVACEWQDTEVTPSMTPPWLKKRVPAPELQPPVTEPTVVPTVMVVHNHAPAPVQPPSLSAEQVREVIQQEIQSALSGLVFPTQQHTPAVQPQIDVDLLAAALVRAGVGSTGQHTGVPVQAPMLNQNDPVFIPSSILPKGTATDSITVASTQTESSGMDEAAAALKASRGSRPKATRRNPTPEE